MEREKDKMRDSALEKDLFGMKDEKYRQAREASNKIENVWWNPRYSVHEVLR